MINWHILKWILFLGVIKIMIDSLADYPLTGFLTAVRGLSVPLTAVKNPVSG
jgi:hypothetical protein